MLIVPKYFRPSKKPAPHPRGLTAAEERLIAAIDAEEAKGEKLREELEERNERVKELQGEEKEVRLPIVRDTVGRYANLYTLATETHFEIMDIL